MNLVPAVLCIYPVCHPRSLVAPQPLDLLPLPKVVTPGLLFKVTSRFRPRFSFYRLLCRSRGSALAGFPIEECVVPPRVSRQAEHPGQRRRVRNRVVGGASRIRSFLLPSQGSQTGVCFAELSTAVGVCCVFPSIAVSVRRWLPLVVQGLRLIVASVVYPRVLGTAVAAEKVLDLVGSCSSLRYTSRRIDEGGCVVKFPTPAWSSTNLLNIAKFVESGLVFAHVRAASDGAVLVGSVNHENTHPFQVRHGPCRWPIAVCSTTHRVPSLVLLSCPVLFERCVRAPTCPTCRRCCAPAHSVRGQ